MSAHVSATMSCFEPSVSSICERAESRKPTESKSIYLSEITVERCSSLPPQLDSGDRESVEQQQRQHEQTPQTYDNEFYQSDFGGNGLEERPGTNQNFSNPKISQADFNPGRRKRGRSIDLTALPSSPVYARCRRRLASNPGWPACKARMTAAASAAATASTNSTAGGGAVINRSSSTNNLSVTYTPVRRMSSPADQLANQIGTRSQSPSICAGNTSNNNNNNKRINNNNSNNSSSLMQMGGLSASGIDLNNLSPGLPDEMFARRASENSLPASSSKTVAGLTPLCEAGPGDSVSLHNGQCGGGGGGGGGSGGPLHNVTTTSTGSSVMRDRTRENLISLMSIIYALFIVSLGTIFAVLPGEYFSELVDQIFSSATYIVGIAWLCFLQVDVAMYKRRIDQRISARLAQLEAAARDADQVSVTTEIVLNSIEREHWQNMDDDSAEYRFQKGRHSGSFFLKTGMAGFCIGHLLYEALVIAKIATATNFNCSVEGLLMLHILRPIYSFYQLFIIFKYSHIIINHCTSLARFGLMHLMATSITSWFRTIILDAQASHDGHDYEASIQTSAVEMDPTIDCLVGPLSNLPLLAYLYPFTIEFSIIMAGVWYIIWTNIGNTASHHSSHAHIEAKFQENEHGDVDLTYRSHLVVSADCHSAKTGLFAGLAVLLLSIVTVTLFFVLTANLAARHEAALASATSSQDTLANSSATKNYSIAANIYNFQDMMLICISLVAVAVAFVKTRSLSFNPAPITFLDDCLLVIPIPFFVVNVVLNIIAELTYEHGSKARACFALLQLIQVLLQTPMLIDGLRRCSHSTKMRYEKPGRELVTFLIIVNLAMWFVYTFEQKKADDFLAAAHVFQDRWIYIGHITVPLMLFYRFHSAVCFADIWKSAYEKDEE